MALVVAGCSGGSSGGGGGGANGSDLTESLTAPQLLAKSADTARKATAFRLAFDGEVTVNLANGASLPGVGLSLDEPVKFSGAGPVKQPDRFGLDVTATVSGLPVQGNLTRVGDDLFLSALGRDFKLDAPAAQVRQLDAFAALPTLAGWISEPRLAGDEVLDGTTTITVTGKVDPQVAIGDLAPLLSSVSGLGGAQAQTPAELRRSAAQLGESLSDSEVTVWIGKSDLLPRKLDVRLAIADGSRLSPQLRALKFAVTVNLSDFGADLTVEPPANPSPLAISDLTGLVGG